MKRQTFRDWTDERAKARKQPPIALGNTAGMLSWAAGQAAVLNPGNRLNFEMDAEGPTFIVRYEDPDALISIVVARVEYEANDTQPEGDGRIGRAILRQESPEMLVRALGQAVAAQYIGAALIACGEKIGDCPSLALPASK